MRPLFTIHAGEFVVGEFIEKSLSESRYLVPAKDTGIDLLVTGEGGRRSISLQVKLSRDYKPLEAEANLIRASLRKAGSRSTTKVSCLQGRPLGRGADLS